MFVLCLVELYIDAERRYRSWPWRGLATTATFVHNLTKDFSKATKNLHCVFIPHFNGLRQELKNPDGAAIHGNIDLEL